MLGVGVQRAAQHAKRIVKALLKAPTRRISLVQFAGVSCCCLRAAIYTLSVALYSQYQFAQDSQPSWEWGTCVGAFYAGADLLPLTVLLWIVRVRQRTLSQEDSELLTRSYA